MSPLNHYKPGEKVLWRNGKSGCRGVGKSGSDGRIGSAPDKAQPRLALRTLTGVTSGLVGGPRD